jgi:hypothetical protein
MEKILEQLLQDIATAVGKLVQSLREKESELEKLRGQLQEKENDAEKLKERLQAMREELDKAQALWKEKPDYQIDGAPGPGFMPVRLMAWGTREACDAYLIAANQTGKGTTWDRGALDRLRHDSAARDWPHTKAALQSLPVLMRPGPPPIVAPSLPSLVRPPPPPEVLAQKKSPPPPDRWGVFGMDLPITSTEHAEMMEALEEYQQANGTYAGAGDHIARAVTSALAERTAQGATTDA